MSTAGVETCPLCHAPRAKRQMRCGCNYTFEYEIESSPFRRVSGTLASPSTPRILLIVVGIAVVAASAAIVLLAT